MINEITISTKQIIQLILQFLKENNFISTYTAFQNETNIKDNFLSSDGTCIPSILELQNV